MSLYEIKDELKMREISIKYFDNIKPCIEIRIGKFEKESLSINPTEAAYLVCELKKLLESGK